ncbi:MAG: hypothetical protein IPO93_11450 [Actinobacteria bacterium]|nr:hypothetical protein [Actinomycetota bacterium]
MVDLGGANGTLLGHVLARLPEAAGIVYDLPQVVGAVKSRDLEGRLTAETGDFDHVPAGADPYLLSMILHDSASSRPASSEPLVARRLSGCGPGEGAWPGDSPSLCGSRRSYRRWP